MKETRRGYREYVEIDDDYRYYIKECNEDSYCRVMGIALTGYVIEFLMEE